jgi:hypothetical protein
VPKAAAAADAELKSSGICLFIGSVARIIEQTKKLMAALKEILADQLLEDVWCVVATERSSWLSQWREQGFKWFAERQYLPGVTDNLARTVEEAIRLSLDIWKRRRRRIIRVASGSAYLFDDSFNIKQVESHCRYRHYHPVTDKFRIHDLTAPHLSKLLEFPQVHLPTTPAPEVVALNLSDTELENLSRTRTLALNLTEMQAIRAYFEQDSVIAERLQYGLEPVAHRR